MHTRNLRFCGTLPAASSPPGSATDPFPLPGPEWRALPSLCPSLVLAPFYLATTVWTAPSLQQHPSVCSATSVVSDSLRPCGL